MKEKNRFSSLLKHLMTVAKLKNYTLAKDLQYDESYISKWVTGSLMPTEKNHEKVLQDISRCVVNSLDEDGWALLQSEYQLNDRSDLEMAIFDNLEAEYRYVAELRESTGSEVAPRTTYYPEMTLTQFLNKMHHPVLRKVKEQEVISVMDILSLDRNYQLGLAMLNNPRNVASRNYPGVTFSMLINLDSPTRDTVYDATFLLNLLCSLADINFNLYTCPQAVGKLIFVARDAYSISGMIIDENHCISVTTSEDVKNTNSIYDRLNSLCSQETLLVRKVHIRNMIRDRSYIQSLISRNQRWVVGFMTEHFLPDDLFEELLEAYHAEEPDISKEELRRIHMLTQSILQEMRMQLVITENAILDFTVTGEMDFFNRKFILKPEQRLRYINHTKDLLHNNKQIDLKVLKTAAIFDQQHIPAPNLFLSDTICHLRMRRSASVNNISVFNKAQLCDMFQLLFEDIWNNQRFATISGDNNLQDFIHYVIQTIRVQIMT